MEHVEIKDKLMDYFQSNILYDEPIEEIDPDSSLIGNGYIDSTGIIGLVTFLEKAFCIRILDNEIVPENFDTISNIFIFINNKVEKEIAAGTRMERNE